jgi:hypothetical protein
MGSRLLTAVAVTALTVTSAYAQSTDTPKASAAPAATNGALGKVTEQKSDQWLASKLIGTNVFNTENQKIGSVSDLLLDKKGEPVAAIIGVGGFLGIGEKKVAMDLKELQFVRSTDGDKVTAHVSKDQLMAAADFKPYVPPRPQQPATANRGPMGAPSPMGAPGGGPSTR